MGILAVDIDFDGIFTDTFGDIDISNALAARDCFWPNVYDRLSGGDTAGQTGQPT